jgi:type IV secretory pathway TraG/TraD family ATPase VirD4
MAKNQIDPIVLAEDCIIEGGMGTTLPNYNVLVVGCSGTGKSLSVNYPTLFAMEQSSVIATFAKGGEARQMARHFKRKGYETMICDMSDPNKSDVCFDPLRYVRNQQDIEELATQCIMGVIQKTVDDYWQRKAVPLVGALIAAALRTREDPTFADVLDLFDLMQVEDGRSSGITTGLDRLFAKLKVEDPDCYGVREYYNFRSLPVKTASCVRDTAAACLSAMFPDTVRTMMKNSTGIDFRRVATKKTALFIITSPVSTAVNCFANLMYGTAIKEMLTYAAQREDFRLPRDVRLVFDDFAVGSKIHNFAEYISIFRSAGISTVILLQSESQLFSIYGEQDGKSIINNVSTYCYFSGGMDLTTCEHVARRVNKPLETILYSPLDRIYIMQAGRKPLVTQRYPILKDPRYLAMKRDDGHLRTA